MYTALTLEKLLKAELRRGEVELGLVSRDNYIVFQPMLPEVISGSIGIAGHHHADPPALPAHQPLHARRSRSIDLERTARGSRGRASARSSSTSSTTTS